jgi:hypothetical protein
MHSLIPCGTLPRSSRKPGFKLFQGHRGGRSWRASDPTLESQQRERIGGRDWPESPSRRSPPSAIPTPIRIGGNVQNHQTDFQVKSSLFGICSNKELKGIILLQAIIAKDGSFQCTHGLKRSLSRN